MISTGSVLQRRLFWFFAVVSVICPVEWILAADPPVPFVKVGESGLVYQQSAQGDRVPDFSFCGYEASAVAPPIVPARIVLEPSGGDDTWQIQSAIDRIATLPEDSSGWRGAVELGAGEFRVGGSLRLSGNGIVLRGSGSNATSIVAIGYDRRPLIIVGSLDQGAYNSRSDAKEELSANSAKITDYVPVGEHKMRVDSALGFAVGQDVRVVHPSTVEWITAVGMKSSPSDDGRGSWLDWKAGLVDQVWHRKVTGVSGNVIQLDVPLTSAIDPSLSPGTVSPVSAPALSHHLGIESMTLVSEAQLESNPKDEEHAWDGVRLNHVNDAWVRSVRFKQFAGSAVLVGRFAQRVTVSDCDSTDPVSEVGGWRRRTFHTLGQQSLFLRCTATDGRHDFSTGPLAPGPNAFVYCKSVRSTEFSGPIGSWASGVLYDNVEIDGAPLALTNLETAERGAGWVAANCMLWNCVAPIVEVRRPPTANNWAVGVWGEFVGDGAWQQLNQFTTPDSLFAAQLAERIGQERAPAVLAQLDTQDANGQPKAQALADVDRQIPRKLDLAKGDLNQMSQLRLKNGWLLIGDQLATGSRLNLSWWRGSILPAAVSEFGPGLTRYVPGHDERYYTDDIVDVAQQMQDTNKVVLEHHWGLWYDRRRDDHQMVRRIDGNVWAPFYELPWARSGEGQAWDGLSRYDLEKFNTWYFRRLSEFADQADARGLILMQYMYFQHNILEAGAHWADFPWRPANCLQDTGFPEPPRYENRKRVFMADDFYDVRHPVRRDLHARYIRHCLDTLGGNSNVLFVLGEEFTGPLHFVQFWLDTIKQWQAENARDVMVVLSTTRDVQDAILQDPHYEALVDVVDLKYWWYTKEGSAYDPAGATNLAPRQQLREWKGPKSRSAESLSRAVFELRRRFPQKAIVCSIAGADPWMTLAAGGSLAELPAGVDRELLARLSDCQPVSETDGYSLKSDVETILYFGSLPPDPEGFARINRKTGEEFEREPGVASDSIVAPEERPQHLWLRVR